MCSRFSDMIRCEEDGNAKLRVGKECLFVVSKVVVVKYSLLGAYTEKVLPCARGFRPPIPSLGLDRQLSRPQPLDILLVEPLRGTSWSKTPAALALCTSQVVLPAAYCISPSSALRCS